MLSRRINRLALILTVLLALLAALVQAAPAAAQADGYTTSAKEPISLWVYVSCANGGAGEVVMLSGTLHTVFHVTYDGAGGFHYTSHFNPQGVTGVGLTTGARYQGTGVTQYQGTSKVGYETTYVDNFRVIGQGPGNNFMVHENAHIRAAADGTITSYHDNFSTECR